MYFAIAFIFFPYAFYRLAKALASLLTSSYLTRYVAAVVAAAVSAFAYCSYYGLFPSSERVVGYPYVISYALAFCYSTVCLLVMRLLVLGLTWVRGKWR